MLQDCLQDSATVAECMKVGGPAATCELDAWHFTNPESRPHRVQHQLGLDLEAVGTEGERIEVPTPERAVPVTEVGEARPVQQVDKQHEAEIARSSQGSEIDGTTTRGYARALHEVGARFQRGDEVVELLRIGTSIGVHHHDDVPARCGKSRSQSRALASLALVHDDDVGSQLARDRLGTVRREPVD
jgi:hypothetical protein